MTRLEYFEMHKKEKLRLDSKVNETSLVLQNFEKGNMGLVPDEVKNSPEFQAAKKDFNNAFSEQRNFNINYVKVFKVELKEERKRITSNRQKMGAKND